MSDQDAPPGATASGGGTGTIRIAVLLLLGAGAASLIGIMLWRFLPAPVTSAVLAILLQERIRALPDVLAGRVFRAFSGLGGLVLQAAVAVFALYYLLRDGDAVMEAVRRLIPLDEERTDFLVTRAGEVVNAAVYGNVFVALLQGTLGALAFWAVGLQTPIVWGAVMLALALIPLVGPAVVWMPGGLILLATGSSIRGVALLAFGFLVISTVDNVVRAYLVGGRAHVHPLVVFLSVLGGIFTFGAVGILVGPVVLVLGFALMEMARLALGEETADAGALTARLLR